MFKYRLPCDFHTNPLTIYQGRMTGVILTGWASFYSNKSPMGTFKTSAIPFNSISDTILDPFSILETEPLHTYIAIVSNRWESCACVSPAASLFRFIAAPVMFAAPAMLSPVTLGSLILFIFPPHMS